MGGQNAEKHLIKGAAVTTVALIGAAAAAVVLLLRKADLHIRPNTLFGHASVFTVKDGAGDSVRMLAVGRSVQSGTYLGDKRFELPFEYHRAFEHAVMAKGAAHDVLMLGGGACAYPKHALAAHEDMRMDVIEIDPAIVELARRWFYLDELEARAGDRLSIHIGDALDYLVACGKSYDVIINDLFASGEAVRALLSDEGMALVKAHLRADGLYLVNTVCPPSGYRRLQEVGEALERQFPQVEMAECTDADFSDDENYLFIARL